MVVVVVVVEVVVVVAIMFCHEDDIHWIRLVTTYYYNYNVTCGPRILYLVTLSLWALDQKAWNGQLQPLSSAKVSNNLTMLMRSWARDILFSVATTTARQRNGASKTRKNTKNVKELPQQI